jgi:DUF438 domain-containing protein
MSEFAIREETLLALLDSFVDPIVFVDTNHVIRYLNQVAIEKYQEREHEQLVGASIFDCHNERSGQIIWDIFESFEEGEDERLLVAEEGSKIFMRAVRDSEGRLIGYYERFEKV